jgi:hypothetical protein
MNQHLDRREKAMEVGALKMEGQLRRWGVRIDNLAAKTLQGGVAVRFDTHMYVDELKALHAIAQTKFDQYKVASGPERTRLAAEVQSAWNELDTAFKNPKPSSPGQKT